MFVVVPFWFSIDLFPVSTPKVDSYDCLNYPFKYRFIKQDFPVAESPTNAIFICFIYFCAVTLSFFVFSIIYQIVYIFKIVITIKISIFLFFIAILRKLIN